MKKLTSVPIALLMNWNCLFSEEESLMYSEAGEKLKEKMLRTAMYL